MVDIRLAALGRSLLAAALLAGPAAADPPAVFGARKAAEVTFRDWRLACLGEACAIRASLSAADGTALLAVSADARALGFATTLPLFLPDGIVLTLGDEAPRRVAWRTCGPAGCDAETPLDPGLLAALRRERAAEATLTLVDGVRIRLPVSLLGFTAGWKAREARDPTPPPPPAPAPRPQAGEAPRAAPEPEAVPEAVPETAPESATESPTAAAPGAAPAVDPWDVVREADPGPAPSGAAGRLSRP